MAGPYVTPLRRSGFLAQVIDREPDRHQSEHTRDPDDDPVIQFGLTPELDTQRNQRQEEAEERSDQCHLGARDRIQFLDAGS